ncbi:chaperone protein dnaJ [Musa troglodytarum]|nr:chaperone protein dnaJ [Musa troglodytarum]
MQLRVSATARPAQTKSATMYELLSVEKTAGPEEIKAAYRVQARRWHPDVCRTAVDKAFFAERFMRAREAYEVLSDPSRRRDYDVSLLRADGWAIAVGAEAAAERRRRCAGEKESWGSRMRRADGWKASD